MIRDPVHLLLNEPKLAFMDIVYHFFIPPVAFERDQLAQGFRSPYPMAPAFLTY